MSFKSSSQNIWSKVGKTIHSKAKFSLLCETDECKDEMDLEASQSVSVSSRMCVKEESPCGGGRDRSGQGGGGVGGIFFILST